MLLYSKVSFLLGLCFIIPLVNLSKSLLLAENLKRNLGCLTSLSHFYKDDDWTNMPSYTMTSPSNPLYNWTLSFLTLTTNPLPSGKLSLADYADWFASTELPWREPMKRNLQSIRKTGKQQGSSGSGRGGLKIFMKNMGEIGVSVRGS